MTTVRLCQSHFLFVGYHQHHLDSYCTFRFQEGSFREVNCLLDVSTSVLAGRLRRRSSVHLHSKCFELFDAAGKSHCITGAQIGESFFQILFVAGLQPVRFG